MEVLEVTPAIARAREHWRYRGGRRPSFAQPTGPGEESVWDFPRPPRMEPVADELRVDAGDTEVARTRSGVRVVETAGAPTYYFPPDDVRHESLTATGNRSLCEWKGAALSYNVGSFVSAAWCYELVFEEFAAIQGWFAFYPSQLQCYVGDERVQPQPGGYYGGWVTDKLRGPIKGEPGTEHW